MSVCIQKYAVEQKENVSKVMTVFASVRVLSVLASLLA